MKTAYSIRYFEFSMN